MSRLLGSVATGWSLPGVREMFVAVMARAAQRAQNESNIAAIAGDLAAETYGLVKLNEAIQDIAHNTTRFYVIGRRQCRQRF